MVLEVIIEGTIIVTLIIVLYIKIILLVNLQNRKLVSAGLSKVVK